MLWNKEIALKMEWNKRVPADIQYYSGHFIPNSIYNYDKIHYPSGGRLLKSCFTTFLIPIINFKVPIFVLPLVTVEYSMCLN